MVDVILYSFLASFFLILLGTGIYIRYRENISKIAIKEKISRLNSHFQEHRYRYLGIVGIALIPILYYAWDEFINPYKINYFPGPNVPPPQPVNNNDNDIFLFFDLPIMVFQFFKPLTLGLTTIFMSVLLLLGPRIFKFNKNGFLFQTSLGIIVSALLFFSIAVVVINIFGFIILLLFVTL